MSYIQLSEVVIRGDEKFVSKGNHLFLIPAADNFQGSKYGSSTFPIKDSSTIHWGNQKQKSKQSVIRSQKLKFSQSILAHLLFLWFRQKTAGIICTNLMGEMDETDTKACTHIHKWATQEVRDKFMKTCRCLSSFGAGSTTTVAGNSRPHYS